MLATVARTTLVRRTLPTVSCAKWIATAEAGGSRVVQLTSDSEYEQAMKDLAASNSAAIVDFTAKWCGPCKMIAPVYEQLASDFPSVRFFKVDIDTPELAATIMGNSISAVPTFVGHRGTSRLSAFSGADRAQLQRLVLELTNTAKSG